MGCYKMVNGDKFPNFLPILEFIWNEEDCDEEVLTVLKGRDRSALKILWIRYNRRVYTLALAITKDEYLAQDVLQDTFLNLIQLDEHLLPQQNFRSWLDKTVKNHCINLLKRKKLVTNQEHILMRMEDEQNKSIEERELQEKLLADLTEEERNILIYKYIDGLSYKQIAEKLGKKKAQVKDKAYRIRKKLQKNKKRYDFWGGDVS